MVAASHEERATREEAEKRAYREGLLKILLTSEARQRLMNVRMVKPQVAKMIEDSIIQQASSGRLKKVITDDELKEILLSMQQQKREFKFRRI